jgi:hypothetical protein
MTFRSWLEENVTAPRVVVMGCIILACGGGIVVGWVAHILRRIP